MGWALAAAALALIVAACSATTDPAEAPSPPPTASIAAPSPSRSTPPSAAPPLETPVPGCPAPDVEAPDGATVLADGCTEVTVGAQDLVRFDGSSVLVGQGENPPACAAFTLTFGWTVAGQQPVQFLTEQQGVEELVASGTSGTGSGYCGAVRIENPSDRPVEVAFRYVLGDSS